MILSRPLIRFRRTRSELFQEGRLRRARQQVTFEFGATADLRAEVADLRKQITRLTAELAKQKAIDSMTRGIASKPGAQAVCPACRGLATHVQLFVGDWSNYSLIFGQPICPATHKPAEEQPSAAITLVADENAR